MDKFRLRKSTLKIRAINNTMEYANTECKRQIDSLNQSKCLCSCPICKNNQQVRCTGSNKGNLKFICECTTHDHPLNFSTSTSYEAIEFYRDTMSENLCLLAHTNSTIKGTTLYNETSKYFVEYAHEALYEFIINNVNQQEINIDKNLDLITIFFDLSGSKLSKNKAIILAKIEDNIMFEIVSHSNHLSTHQLISSIKDRLNISENTQIIFVTDGERCFVDSIKHYFPNTIHIRQFHKKSCKGMIYIHFKYDKKEYTLRCLWDAVLNDGIPSKKVIKQREFKASKRIDNKERKREIQYSELSKDVMLWEGTVYLPRGSRRILNKKINIKSTFNGKTKNTSTGDTSKLIFRGNIEDVKKIDITQRCFHVLKKIFGGLYITSNIVETIFNVKAKLSPHRVMKYGQRMLVCVLYSHVNLKNKKKRELLAFFKNKIITYDLIMKNVLYGSGIQKNKPIEISFLDSVNEAILKGRKLVIHYVDRFKKHTARTIKPIKIIRSDYDGTTKIEAFCDLRNAKRIFYLERMRDLVIYNPKPIIF